MEVDLGNVYGKAIGHALPVAEPQASVGIVECVAVCWSHNMIGLSYLDIGKVKAAMEYFERAAVGQQERGLRLERAAISDLGLAYADLLPRRWVVELSFA